MNNKTSQPFKLDLKDKKILAELDNNCRQPSSQIAKKVGLSTEVTNYRIKRLEKENIITQYQTAINLAKLGIVAFKIFLCFQHITSEKLNSLIEKLKKNNNAKWLVSCNGAWDLVVTLETDSFFKVDEIKNQVLNLFSGFISKKAIAITTYASAYNRAYIHQTQNTEKPVYEESKIETLELIDLKILKLLSQNARKSTIDLATELNTTARIVNYRIQQLIKNKVIEGFRIAINYEKLGILFYKGFVYLDTPKKERVEELVNYFKQHKNIIHHVKIIGNWDLEPEFEVTSEEEFNKILTDIKDKFSDIIKNIDIITISKEHKFIYF